jgi:hypothetical protein
MAPHICTRHFPPPDIALSPPPRAPCKPYQNQIRGSRSNWRRRRGTYSRRNRIGSREPLRRNLGSDSCCRQRERFSGVSDMGSFSSAGNVGGAVAAQARNWSNWLQAATPVPEQLISSRATPFPEQNGPRRIWWSFTNILRGRELLLQLPWKHLRRCRPKLHVYQCIRHSSLLLVTDTHISSGSMVMLLLLKIICMSA